jgi:hypothetical protein
MLRAFQLPHRVPLVAPHAAPLWLCMLQGGCTALEDGIILARMLRQVWDSSDSRVIERALREFEENRTARCLPLVVRSHLIGRALQSGFPPVVAARNFATAKVLDPAHLFDHAIYDCGSLATVKAPQRV